MSVARNRLREAQKAHAAATAALQDLADQRKHLLEADEHERDVQAKVNEAHAAHAAAMLEWAKAGAKGNPPEAPASITKLTRDLAAAQAETAAGRAAAGMLAQSLELAQQTANGTLSAMRHARDDVLFEILAPMVDEYHRAAERMNSLREHLAGVTYAFGPRSQFVKQEVPAIGDIGQRIRDAIIYPVELVPGGAEASRDAWADLIAALATDADAQLSEPPESKHVGNVVRKPFLPERMRPSETLDAPAARIRDAA